MRYHRQVRHGFTLVEMLVVVAIIGVLMSLLLPAVGAIRESARNMQCLQNLKSIGTAMEAYHNNNYTFPINYGKLSGGADCNSFSTTTGSLGSLGRSWLVGLLPYIDQQDLFNTVRNDQGLNWIDNSVPSSSPLNLRQPNVYVAQMVIPIYLCPSDRVDTGQRTDRDLTGNWAVVNYNAVSGSNWVFFEPIDVLPDPLSSGYEHLALPSVDPTWLFYTSGKHAFEPNGMDCGNGIINRGAFVAESTSIDNITDGRSNTIAVGEVLPTLHPKKWWFWWDGATATAAVPINFRPVQPTDGTGEPMMPTYSQWERNCGFQSRHVGSGNFLIADGSARSIDETVDIFLLRKLGNYSGGEADGVMPAE